MIVLGPVVLILSFLGMEFMAWFTHKYVMHGLMWRFHKDHHQVEKGFFERNDVFFMIYQRIKNFLESMVFLVEVGHQHFH